MYAEFGAYAMVLVFGKNYIPCRKKTYTPSRKKVCTGLPDTGHFPVNNQKNVRSKI